MRRFIQATALTTLIVTGVAATFAQVPAGTAKVEVTDAGLILYTFDVLEEAATLLGLVEPKSPLPIRLVDQYPADLKITFHTDIHIVETGASMTKDGRAVCRLFGTYAFASNPIVGSRQLEPQAGLPGTRMDISRLRTSKQALSFVGKSWIPKTDKGAVIIVTRDGIVGVNVTAK